MRRPDRIDAAWALLLALTVAGMAALRSGAAAPLVDAAVLGLAVLKARLVCLDFLGLRRAPSGWRRGIALGVALVAAAALAGALLSGIRGA